MERPTEEGPLGRPTSATPAAELLEQLSRRVPGFIYQYRQYPDGRSCFPYASEGVREIYEVTPEEVIQDASVVYARLHPDDLDHVRRRIQASYESLTLWEDDYRVVLPARGLRWLHGSASPERLEDGSVLWHGNIYDVTERRSAEEAARQLSERLELATRSAVMGIWDYDVAQGHAAWNPLMYELYGVDPNGDGYSLEHWLALLHPDDRDRLAAALEIAVAIGETIAEDFRVIRPDGQLRYFRSKGLAKAGADGRIARVTGVTWDVTEQRNLEEQLRQAQKLEAIGTLAGGVAHDFNNLLHVINGYTELIMASQQVTEPVRDLLGQVQQAGDRAARLVSQLLTFSRRTTLSSEPLDLNEVVGDLLKMLQRVIGENIAISFQRGQLPQMVVADRGMLEQVVMNLAVNARDAMPDGGTLSIGLSTERFDAGDSRIPPWARAGSYVVLEVRDTGCGMSPEVLGRIWEPFFTTKEVGRGTGLGLPTVYGIVEQHSGFIVVDSEVGRGTCFRVCLPAAKCAATPKPREPLHAPSESGHGTILLAEDDSQVRDLVQQLLLNAGYHVVAVADGAQAMAAFAKCPDDYDLVILDVIMPHHGGVEVYESIRVLAPACPVLFTTGYSESSIRAEFFAQRGIVPLTKPYQIDELLARVRALLNAAKIAPTLA